MKHCGWSGGPDNLSGTQAGCGRARRFKIAGTVLAVGLLALATAAWLATGKHGIAFWKSDSPAAGNKHPTMELAAADVATVGLANLNRSLPVTGSLSPLVQTTLKAQVPGEVLQVTVREGQTVHKGDVLVRIDTRNLKAQLDDKQAALEKAHADLALAKLNLDNNARMLKGHFISQNAFDTVNNTYQVSLANEKAAEAQVELAQIALDYATVRAPFDGTISQRYVQPGEKVDVDTSLLGLVDLTHLELQSPAPDYEVPSVKIGQVAKFHVGGFGDRVFVGHVQRINPMTNAGSRSIMLYVSVDNPEQVLKGGMFAQGELILDKTPPVAAIPLSAVHTYAGLPYVYVIDHNRIQRRDVTLGLKSEEQNMVEVRKGLEVGEMVVAARIDTLKEGDPVTVTAPAAGNATAAASAR